jgi:hypothetical protein
MSSRNPETPHTPTHTDTQRADSTHTHTRNPNPFGPEAYFKSLPDTEANRKILTRWIDQDARGGRFQQQLFPHVQDPVPLPPTVIKAYQFDNATITLQSDDEIDTPSLPVAALDRLIVSKMISGSTAAQISTSETIFLHTSSAVDIGKEFPAVYAHKRYHKASALEFVSYVKDKKHIEWPINQHGSELRDCLDRLAPDLMAEYSTPPKLIAILGIVALYQMQKQKPNLLSDFHAGLNYPDDDFPEFQELYSQGCSNDLVVIFKPSPMQPGFDRLVGTGSADVWIDTAAVLMDSVSFKCIGNLEQECCTARKNWKGFTISDHHRKSARAEEMPEQFYMSNLMGPEMDCGLT